jgi:hypothetical protein
MATRPEEWTLKGEPEEKIKALYGPIIHASTTDTKEREALATGERAHARMTAQALSRYGGNKAVLASAAPWTGERIITGRALLMRREGGYVPIAHLGTAGHTALTEEQAAQALEGKTLRDAEPPGGWRDGSWGGVMTVVERVGDYLKSPPVEVVAVALSGAVATDRAVGLVKKYDLLNKLKGLFQRKK